MMFRDQMLVCDQCGSTFFFTVTEQRRMAEELGSQEIEAPHLCPKCRQSGTVPAAVSEAPLDAKAAEHEPEAVESVVESVVVPEAVSEPEPELEPEPEPELEPEPEPEGEPEPEPEPEPVSVSEPLPAFDESLLDDLGIKVKLIGQVKWFSRKKGFGFVTKADGEELFFHRSDVLEADLRQLRDGIQVEFQIRRTEKGLEAFDVSILPAS